MSFFFDNIGIGEEQLIKDWIKTSDTTDLQCNRIKLNNELNFSVIKNPELVFGNIIYHVIKKKDLPECIIFDFKKFSTLHLGDIDRFKIGNGLHNVNNVDDWIKLLNIIDDHIINLTEISFIENMSVTSCINRVFTKHNNKDWKTEIIEYYIKRREL